MALRVPLFVVYVFLMLCACSDENSPVPEPIVIFDGDVTLRSQSQVDEFAKNKYKVVTGFLQIGGYEDQHANVFDSNITDLSGLIDLEKAEGGLYIGFAPNLQSLKGLDSLSYVGYLTIDDLFELESYEGLNALETIDGDLYLSTNLVMDSLDAFKSLQYVKDRFYVGSHIKLKVINGPTSLREVGSLVLGPNGMLGDIQGLRNLEIIHKDFHVMTHPDLFDFCSLQPAITNGPLEGVYHVENNGYNPSRQDFFDGKCKN